MLPGCSHYPGRFRNTSSPAAQSRCRCLAAISRCTALLAAWRTHRLFHLGFIPAEWIAAHAGADNPLAIPFSAIVGIPLYIRAEAVIPLASVLLGKGMGMGAVMALIIGSAGASLTEVILLKSMFRTPMIAAFLTVILGMAILMGYLTQLLF